MNKILIIIPDLGRGGAERVVQTLSGEFQKKNEVYIAIFQDIIDYEVNCKIFNLNTPGTFFLPKKLLNFIKRYHKLKRLIKQIKPDVVFSLLESPNLFNLLLTERPILSIHENKILSTNMGALKFIDNLIIRGLYGNAFKIVVVSKGLKTKLINFYKIDKNKIKVIYNPIDINYIRTSLREEIEDQYRHIFSYPVIINIGRLSIEKGQIHLIRAFDSIRKDIPDLKLVLLGAYREWGRKLFELREESPYKEDIHFLGSQKNPYKFLARSKLFVFPSLWEGFGISVIEALACGIPVISSDCRYGPREILSPSTDFEYQTKDIEFGEYGVLVPVCNEIRYNELDRNEQILAKAIYRMISDPSLCNCYSMKGLKRAADFDVSRIIEEYEDLFSVVQGT